MAVSLIDMFEGCTLKLATGATMECTWFDVKP